MFVPTALVYHCALISKIRNRI
eukprot:COSAG03_NODE_19817_length_329_cov_1.078261_1_plen_21_part_10